MKFLIGIIVISLSAHQINAQNYSVKSFEEFEKFIANQNDTLYIINFWATWCKPCIEEIPNFEKVNRENQKVKVILVSLDGQSVWEKSLQPFLIKNNIQSTVWVMPDKKPIDWIDRIDNRWQGSVPGTLFLNNAAGIKIFEEHEFTYEQLLEKIKSIQS